MDEDLIELRRQLAIDPEDAETRERLERLKARVTEGIYFQYRDGRILRVVSIDFTAQELRIMCKVFDDLAHAMNGAFLRLGEAIAEAFQPIARQVREASDQLAEQLEGLAKQVNEQLLEFQLLSDRQEAEVYEAFELPPVTGEHHKFQKIRAKRRRSIPPARNYRRRVLR